MIQPASGNGRLAAGIAAYDGALAYVDGRIGALVDELDRKGLLEKTIVIVTADNGAWLDAYPDAGTIPFRGEKGSAFEGGWRVPGIMWWPNHVPAGAKYGEMMSHIDCWATLAAMVGLTPPPHGEWKDNNGKPIYFDSIDNSLQWGGTCSRAYHVARKICGGRQWLGAFSHLPGIDRI